MSKRDEQAHMAASMYYLQQQTMDSIAKQLDVSYSTVSRLLKYARKTGLVRITLAPEPGVTSPLVAELEEQFGVNVELVQVRPEATEFARLRQVAKVGAAILSDMLQPDMVLGVAWGNTTSEVARQITPRPVPGLTVVQFNGAGNSTTSGIGYSSNLISDLASAFGANSILFPVPAFFDYGSTKEAMWRERSVQRVLDVQRQSHVALFSVGAFQAAMPSHVYSGGYLEERDILTLRGQGVVGDVCTVFMREDGTWEDIEINQRATGLTPQLLKTIEKRLCVVTSPTKAFALLGALRAGVATDLVLDSQTATRLYEISQGKPARHGQSDRWRSL